MMTPNFQPGDPARFAAALHRFDEENGRDPNRQMVEGKAHPRQLLEAEWLTAWVLRLCPEASEELRLAARCQHLCRWQQPREDYPSTRAGYLQWREGLKRFHAELAGKILREVGYPEATIARVQALNLKQGFPQDPETRVLEDALCLVFLERQLAALADKTAEEKVVNALRKSWQKMTPAAQTLAKGFAYGPREQALLQEALAG